MVRIAVALLAEERPCHLEQLILVGPMRIMAVQAAFPDRCVFPEKRATLFRVAGVAGLVDRVPLEHRFGGGSVWIMTVHAGHFPLWQRHVGAFGKFGPLLFVAGVAGFVDRCFLKEAAVGDLRHRVVTVAARQLVSAVGRIRPEHGVATLVAGKAHAVLDRDGRSPFASEGDQRAMIFWVGGILDVVGTRAVAGFAGPLLQFIPRIQPKYVGMQRMGKLVVLRCVACDAHGFAYVFSTTIQWFRGFDFGC